MTFRELISVIPDGEYIKVCSDNTASCHISCYDWKNNKRLSKSLDKNVKQIFSTYIYTEPIHTEEKQTTIIVSLE